MNHSELDEQRSAYAPSFKFHDENELMLSYYVDRVVSSLRTHDPKFVVSLGIGQQIVCSRLIAELAPRVDRYHIVEGSRAAIEELTARTALPESVSPVLSFFEDYEPDGPVDAVEMGFVLEHVDDPGALLSRYARLLKPGGRAYIAVPNARSLHRLIGHEAGLLDNLYRLSAEDLELGHRRYYDLESLVTQVLQSGLKIAAVEGILLKPLTTSQLASLTLPENVIQALARMGSQFPGVSNALYIEAVA